MQRGQIIRDLRNVLEKQQIPKHFLLHICDPSAQIQSQVAFLTF